MAPTPYTPTGKLRIEWTWNLLAHHIDIPCNIGTAAGSLSTIVNYQPGQPYPTILQAGDNIWNLFRFDIQNTVAAPSATLFQRDVNVFIPLGTVGLTAAGGGATAGFVTTQTTMFFRDDEQHAYKFVIMEGINPAPNKFTYGANASFDALSDGITLAQTGLNPHDWMRSRADLPITRFLDTTISLNRKLRRARGYA